MMGIFKKIELFRFLVWGWRTDGQPSGKKAERGKERECQNEGKRNSNAPALQVMEYSLVS
jgi:hypothetical protein